MKLHLMKGIPNTLRALRMRICRGLRRIPPFLKKNGGRIAYYGLVVLALCAIARAAEVYRSGSREEALVLPEAYALDVIATEQEEDSATQIPEAWKLLRGFSGEPQWRAELGMWEAHPAVDYDCGDAGVLCLRDGVVRTVGESGVYGGFVEVESDGMLMRYASIEPADGLEPGLALEAGDAIGTADASMPGEADAGAHLHLELYLDGEAVDFVQYAAAD